MAKSGNTFRWMTPEQRLTAGWMVREALKEKGFENLAAAAKCFSEFLVICRADYCQTPERVIGKSLTTWN